MRVDKEFCKSTDDGFVRSLACRKGKGLTRTVRTEHCSFRGGKWNYQAADWSPQEMELSIGLCSWQIWQAPIARSALASGSPCCHKPHLCYHGLFVHGPSVQWQRWLGKEIDCSKSKSFCLLDYWTLPLLKSPFDEHLHEMHVSWQITICRYLSTYFPRFLSYQFSSQLFPSLWPSPGWMNQLKSRILSFLLPNKINDHVYCLKFCLLWWFPFASDFQGCARKGL